MPLMDIEIRRYHARIVVLVAALIAILGQTSVTAQQEHGGQTSRDVPWLSEVQSPTEPILQITLPRLIDDQTTLEDWQNQRVTLRKDWLEFLNPIPRPQTLPPVTILSDETVDGVRRQLLQYTSEAGWVCEAYQLTPIAKSESKRASRRYPGVVVFHSTVNHSIRQPAGVEGKTEKAFAMTLAKRGFVTFCPRNFLWPSNHKIDANSQTALFHKRHPNRKGMAKMLYDAQLAVDLLLSHPQVDSSRIGAVGHSLGAKEVLYLAAMDERVKVSVSSEGGIGMTFSNWDAAWYLGPLLSNWQKQHDHHELLALVAPRPFLLVGGNSADGKQSWPYVMRASEVYRLYGSPARMGQLVHGRGHAVPPIAEKKIYEWLETYLR